MCRFKKKIIFIFNSGKMFYGLFFSGLIALAYGVDIDLFVQPGAGVQTLVPKNSHGLSETRWKLKTVQGAKMILLCSLQIKDCSKSSIVIWNGEKAKEVCDELRPVSRNDSIRNEMTVTITSRTGGMAGYCQVEATDPYMNFVEKFIDSTEHGDAKKAKKSPTCKCGWTNKRKSRIVGGKEAGINEYPFPILLMKKQVKSPFCGGSIITSRHALTAAHCTYPYRKFALSIAVGEHDITTYSETKETKIIDVAQAIDHENYNPRSNLNDISVLYLKEKIQFNQFVGPVCMPSIQKNLQEDYIKVMGWGLTTHEGRPSPALRKVNLKVIDLAVCEQLYGLSAAAKTQICTYMNNKDSCQGDSGGPLVHLDQATNMYSQIGVVSYGRNCASTDPAVNTDVAAYVSWLKKIIRSTSNEEMCYV